MLGTRFASKPLELDIPITIAGHELRRPVGQRQGGAGPGGERGRDLDHHRRRRHDRRGADGIEAADLPVPAVALRLQPRPPAPGRRDRVVIGQGAKPGGGGMLLGPEGVRPGGRDAQPAAGHRPALSLPPPRLDRARRPEDQDRGTARGDRLGDTDLREARRLPGRPTTSSWRSRRGPMWSWSTACRAAPAATQDFFIEHTGIPTLAAVRRPPRRWARWAWRTQVQLIVSGGIRTGADVAKALALGADAVSIGVAAADRPRLQQPHLRQDGARSRRHGRLPRRWAPRPGFCHHCHTGRCPVGVTTQDPLDSGSTPDGGARRVTNYLKAMTMERPRSPGPAASPTCTTWSRRTWSR